MSGFTHMQQEALATMKKAFDEQVARWGSLVGKASEVEHTTGAQAATAVDEWARLMKATIGWQGEIMAAWRKQTLDAMTAFSAFVPQPPSASPGA